jgi:hypothetical protein
MFFLPSKQAVASSNLVSRSNDGLALQASPFFMPSMAFPAKQALSNFKQIMYLLKSRNSTTELLPQSRDARLSCFHNYVYQLRLISTITRPIFLLPHLARAVHFENGVQVRIATNLPLPPCKVDEKVCIFSIRRFKLKSETYR